MKQYLRKEPLIQITQDHVKWYHNIPNSQINSSVNNYKKII
jgi:hypothetical protein